MTTVLYAISSVWLVAEYVLKIWAIGSVPENRRPSASSAWLLLILFIPLVGFPLYFLIGSKYVSGRRHDIQRQANQLLSDHADTLPDLPQVQPEPDLDSILRMNRELTGLSCVSGSCDGVFPDTADFFAAIAAAVDQARDFVHVEFYIVSWDESTDVVFQALERAAGRGVEVRLLLDHLGSRKYPGRKELGPRMDAAGIEWHLMMPLNPLRKQWQRPDLRNHRKLVVVDGETAFVGSHNLIDPAYGSAKNARMGRAWSDVSVQVSGDVVIQVSAVFVTDWYTETGQNLNLDHERYFPDQPDLVPGGAAHAMQLVPSGPGFPTEPNWRLFVSLIHMARERVAITTPTSCRTRRCWRRSPARSTAGCSWSSSSARRPTSCSWGTRSAPTTRASWRPGSSSTSTRRRRCCTASTSPSTTGSRSSARATWTSAPSPSPTRSCCSPSVATSCGTCRPTTPPTAWPPAS
ncbi:Cardiolipin synthetase [Serinicoccus hydrothermalis]|uniref:Cardiolipin synthetase n=1 Tax=Serinicoccus hydrothermalis TaxID=1758689 RepID=A0A1B1N8K3_9MICO|nr:Cardiolipin synthetase [Serinicoccus hydrothermalis]